MFLLVVKSKTQNILKSANCVGLKKERRVYKNCIKIGKYQLHILCIFYAKYEKSSPLFKELVWGKQTNLSLVHHLTLTFILIFPKYGKVMMPRSQQ